MTDDVKAITAVEPEEDEELPLIELVQQKAPADLPKDQRVLLFRKHGVSYYAPKEPSAYTMINYRAMAAAQGNKDNAAFALIVNLMGMDAWEALQGATDETIEKLTAELKYLLPEEDRGNREDRRRSGGSPRRS